LMFYKPTSGHALEANLVNGRFCYFAKQKLGPYLYEQILGLIQH